MQSWRQSPVVLSLLPLIVALLAAVISMQAPALIAVLIAVPASYLLWVKLGHLNNELAQARENQQQAIQLKESLQRQLDEAEELSSRILPI